MRWIPIVMILAALASCGARQEEDELPLLNAMLSGGSLSEEGKYAVTRRIAERLISRRDFCGAVLFLTGRVEQEPESPYNSYWLLLAAESYLEQGAEPMAEYYFERALRTADDLSVRGESVHKLCLQNLIRISRSSTSRIDCFKQLASRFPEDVSAAEMYWRLATEYEGLGEWELAMASFKQFVACEDSSSVRIAGFPDAYESARRLVDFANSPKNWTFESLGSLERAVKSAISRYDWQDLDRCRSKANFFAMSWSEDSSFDRANQKEFSMRNFMLGNQIRFDRALDESSNAAEAYLRTTGWNSYLQTWYLYFRKVNFPADPEIHGRWEWAGIYFGEKL